MPEISYCQGMNFVMSVLIAEAGEEKGFFVFLHMLVHYDMKSLFLPVSSNSLAIKFRDFLSCI